MVHQRHQGQHRAVDATWLPVIGTAVAPGAFFFFNLFLAALGLRCCARASHCGGFSCCRAWALDARASIVATCGLRSCSAWALGRVDSVGVALGL